MQIQQRLALSALAMCGLATAQTCALPPGTVGIGKYCAASVPAATPTSAAPAVVAAKPVILAQNALASTADSAGAPPNPALPLASAPANAAARVYVPGSTRRTWQILPTDGRLATTFERWAKADGMKLVWDAQQHVMLSSADSFTGTLTEALNRVLTSPAIRLSSYPLEACIYPNDPPLLRITRVGDQAQECPQP